MKRRKQLDLISRQDIYKMRDAGKSLREISKVTGFGHSVISRELSRNGPRDKREEAAPPCIQAVLAQERAKARRTVKRRPRQRLKCAEIRNLVVELIQPAIVQLPNGEKLRLPGLTPEQIAHEVPKRLPGKSISHEAIYQWILIEARALIEYLPVLGAFRRRRKRTEKVGRRRLKRAATPKKHISQRPASAESRDEFGHRERDAIVSRRGGKGGLQNITERKTRFVRLCKLDSLEAKSGREATIRALRTEPEDSVRSLTNDHGSENMEWKSIEKVLKTAVFFCTAYAPYQRGSNERLNRTVRLVFPKGTDFSTVSEQAVQIVERWMNNRPLKVLKFRTPRELYDEEIAKLPKKAA